MVQPPSNRLASASFLRTLYHISASAAVERLQRRRDLPLPFFDEPRVGPVNGPRVRSVRKDSTAPLGSDLIHPPVVRISTSCFFHPWKVVRRFGLNIQARPMQPTFRYLHHLIKAENPDILIGRTGTQQLRSQNFISMLSYPNSRCPAESPGRCPSAQPAGLSIRSHCRVALDVRPTVLFVLPTMTW